MHKLADTLKGVGAILLLLGVVAFWVGTQIDDGIPSTTRIGVEL